VDVGASLIVSFIDNSLFTLKDKSEFSVLEFDQTSSKPTFILSIPNGKFSFESGSIAKNKEGIMKIKLSGMDVKLNGTLIVGQNSGGNKSVSLVEDSTGNLGTLEIGIEGSNETKVISDSASGVSLTFTEEEQQALSNGDSSNLTTTMASSEDTQLSEEETNSVVDSIKEITVQSATKSEEKIERAIAKQLAGGTIPDANGDGIADSADVEAYKAELLGLKQSKLEYVVEQSNEDLSLLSEIIINSDSDQSMGLMENIMETNAGNASLLMTEMVEQEFDIFSHVSEAQTGNFENLRETIVIEMIQDQSDFVADTMAQMMAISDNEMGAYMMNEITSIEPASNDERNLAMDVLATFAEVGADKMDSYMQEDPSIMANFTETAFANADEGDSEMIADMMQQTNGRNSAYLMSSMMENNSEMISTVYENLAEQEFDIFSHIETAKNDPSMMYESDSFNPAPGDDPLFFTPENDPFLPLPDTDAVFTPGENPANMMAAQANFYDDLKGQIFSEIINNSDQTAAEVTAELMMNSEGDSAMFMMETMMETNPELIGDVMENFMEEDFDIFDHFEDTAIDEPASSASLDPPLDNEINDPTVNRSKKGLTKEERVAAKAERKAERKIIKAEKKAARLQAKAERKAARKAARLAAKQAAQEIGFTTPIESNPDLQEFKTEVFQDMMTYSDDNTMDTMAQLVSSADESTASLIFETVVSEQQNNFDDQSDDTNFALDLMSSLSEFNSEIIDTLYEEQENLVDDMMSIAMNNVTAGDSEAIANIIASSENDEIVEMVFVSIMNSDDESMANDIFMTLADSDDGIDAIMAIASTNQSLYENIAQDIDAAYMTAESLYTNTAAEYSTAATTSADTDTTTYAAGDISWSTYPMTTGTYSTSSYISISGTAVSMNGVNYSASDLPPGLILDYMSGEIFGTPTEPGSWNTTITAEDMMDPANFATASLSFDIIEDNSGGYDSGDGGTFSFMSTPYPPATLTVNNSMTPIYLYTSGGVGNVTFTITGDLPTGIYIMGDEILGTPDTQTFTPSTITIIATDEDGNTTSANLTFPQVNSDGAGGGGSQYGPVWATYLSEPTTLTEGVEMNIMYLDATGTGFLSFTASNLPMGLYVDGEYIRGTPSMQTAYSSSVMITATDDMGSQTKYVTFPQVDAGGGSGSLNWITLDTDFPSTLTVDDPISSVTLDATGPGTISYSYSGSLPPGLFLTADVVSGAPTTQSATETYVTFTAEDTYGNIEYLYVNFPQVDASGGDGVTWNTTPAEFTSLTLTEGTPMSSITLDATGSGTISYADDAMLPAGIFLTAGVVSGTPSSSTETETSVTFVATDDNGDSETLTVSFPIINASGGGSVTWITLDTDFPSTLTENDPISSVTLDASGVGNITYTYTGTLPPGLFLTADVFSGTPSTSSATSTTVTFIATDEDGNDEDLVVTLPQVDGSETITFTTAETLPGVDAGESINETITATASLGSPVAYNFISVSNTGNSETDLVGTGISVTDNIISGIAPRLLNAATYSFEFQASINAGALTNNKNFTLLISQYISCASPT
ncbi:putative Ig domain-containing protein, partial [Pelagibacteraceae bacterium]|nr:putative Ig domain-containing protein [Pelagibacteraceae bacterium]